MDGKLYLPTVVQNSISGIETGIQISVQWRELFGGDGRVKIFVELT